MKTAVMALWGLNWQENAQVDWKKLEGQEFYGEYLAKTDPPGCAECGKSREPCGLRLRHPGLCAER